MAHVVLVHGAWQDNTGWSAVAARLRAEGHAVTAPDLPGHGMDRTPLSGQTLDAYAATVMHAIDAAPEPVTLVGHSMGGIVISTVAELRPDWIARLVYVAAYLLADGQSIQATSATDADSKLGPAMRPSADWSTVAIDVGEAAALFANGCTPAIAAAAVAPMQPEATAPFATPVHTTSARFGTVPRSYITTRNDLVVSPSLQDRMVALLPCAPVIALQTGHLPFLAAPDDFARILLDLLVP